MPVKRQVAGTCSKMERIPSQFNPCFMLLYLLTFLDAHSFKVYICPAVPSQILQIRAVCIGRESSGHGLRSCSSWDSRSSHLQIGGPFLSPGSHREFASSIPNSTICLCKCSRHSANVFNFRSSRQ